MDESELFGTVFSSWNPGATYHDPSKLGNTGDIQDDYYTNYLASNDSYGQPTDGFYLAENGGDPSQQPVSGAPGMIQPPQPTYNIPTNMYTQHHPHMQPHVHSQLRSNNYSHIQIDAPVEHVVRIPHQPQHHHHQQQPVPQRMVTPQQQAPQQRAPIVQQAVSAKSSNQPRSPPHLSGESVSSTPTSPSSEGKPGTPVGSIVQVDLLHKPRGSQGMWKPIHHKQRIRVTHGRGKNLRMVVKSPVEVNWSASKVTLLERSEDAWVEFGHQQDAFSIENRKEFTDRSEDPVQQLQFVLQMDLKLYLIHKTVILRVDCAVADGSSLTSYSPEMSTHNSGRRDTPSDRKRGSDDVNHEEDDENEDGHEEMESSRKRSKLNETDKSVKKPTFNLTGNNSGGVINNGSMRGMMGHNDNMNVNMGYQGSGSNYHPSPMMSQPAGPNDQGAWQIIPSNLEVNGTVRARAFLQYSDLRLKTNVEDIVDALDIVCALSGKSYQWKKGTKINPEDDDDEDSDSIEVVDAPGGGLSDSESSERKPKTRDRRGGKRVIGLIAQEVQRVLPEVVQEGPDGYLAVNYVEIVPVLIEAFKQQFKEFESFKGGLEADVKDLRENLNAMAEIKEKLVSGKPSTPRDLADEIEDIHQRVKRVGDIIKRTHSDRSIEAAEVHEAITAAPAVHETVIRLPHSSEPIFSSSRDKSKHPLHSSSYQQQDRSLPSESPAPKTQKTVTIAAPVASPQNSRRQPKFSVTVSDPLATSTSVSLATSSSVSNGYVEEESDDAGVVINGHLAPTVARHNNVTFSDQIDIEAAGASSTATTNQTTQQPLAIQVHVVQKKDNIWKIISFVLIVIIVLGAGVGLILGLKASLTPAAEVEPEVTWTSNVLSNPSFSTIDYTTGLARNWIGNYDLLVFSTKRAESSDLARDSPSSAPSSAPSDSSCTLPDSSSIPEDAVEHWPSCAWDYMTNTLFSSTPRLRPSGGSVALHLYVNGSLNEIENGIALQMVVPDKHDPGTLVALNVSAEVYTEFTLETTPATAPTGWNPSVELTVFVKYVESNVAETVNIKANPRQRGWVTIAKEIQLRLDYSVESVKVQMFQSYLGHSFWSFVSMDSLQHSGVPSSSASTA